MCSWDAGTGNRSPIQTVTQPMNRGQRGSAKSSMCGGCFPQAEQPAWPQLSKPQALGEDEEEEEGGLWKEALGGGDSAKVRQAEAAGSVGTVRVGMCEMLRDEVSSYSQTA
ncbi:hypothetical protein L3Q82_025694 [Xyrichtys novacula]|uniref:Uncharacterized protein n=1 Tax=Xyrichtys novacula TaxID=13765 RepID=A0AAV1FK61_XYRNO|nr:hypothetical protein L3Q82_025694 [Xyrichtys novacula]